MPWFKYKDIDEKGVTSDQFEMLELPSLPEKGFTFAAERANYIVAYTIDSPNIVTPHIWVRKLPILQKA